MMKKNLLLTVGSAALMIGAASTAGAFTTSGKVVCDANQNQLFDATDEPLPGVEVVLTPVTGGTIRSDLTAVDGHYEMSGLETKTYEATLTPETLPEDAVVIGVGAYPHVFTFSESNPFEQHDFLVDSSICAPMICGDGYLDEGEECDDGNNIDGDGCSAICTDERIEGCTPGYWRQEHHFDSYSAPYAPTTLFSDVFEDAFPGMTLAEVSRLKKAGLNGLGRHAVAALLNAASDDVAYGASVSQVIDAFNAVYPGTKDEYNALKDDFEAMNVSGCPLN